MSLEKQSPTILRFGVFEVDARAGEVRKQGMRIKLQEQPFHVVPPGNSEQPKGRRYSSK
jgi:hypothetical protein